MSIILVQSFGLEIEQEPMDYIRGYKISGLAAAVWVQMVKADTSDRDHMGVQTDRAYGQKQDQVLVQEVRVQGLEGARMYEGTQDDSEKAKTGTDEA